MTTELPSNTGNTETSKSVELGTSTLNANSALNSGLTEDQINSLMANIVIANDGTGYPLYTGKTNENIFNFQTLVAGSGILLKQDDDGIHIISTGATEAGNGLATVATSGSYTDLTNTPVIPSKLTDMSDVALTATNVDQILTYNGSKWTNESLSLDGVLTVTDNKQGTSLFNVGVIKNNTLTLNSLASGSGIELTTSDDGTITISLNGDAPDTSIWIVGTTAPTTDVGSVNDLYLNSTTSDVYQYQTGGWVLVDNLKGPIGEQGPVGPTGSRGSLWTSGKSNPTSTDALANDFYLDTTSGEVYIFDGTIWTQSMNIIGPQGNTGQQGIQGITGARGATWTVGEGSPTSTTAMVNDLYLNFSNGDVYQYTTIWNLIGNITGPTGDTGQQGIPGNIGPQGIRGSYWFTGSGVPSTEIEANTDDMYLDTDTADVYQYSASVWTKISNIKGSTGNIGPQGEPGVSMTNQGTWVSGKTYNPNDYVIYKASPTSTNNAIFIVGADKAFVSSSEPYVDVANWYEIQGEMGERGTIWSTGPTQPSSGVLENDLYLDNNSNVYQYLNSSWTLIQSIKGAPGSVWTSGAADPTGAANSGDMYLNTTTSTVFQYTDGKWVSIVVIKGPKGDTGETGAGLENKGTWVSGTTYKPNDYVFAPISEGSTSNTMYVFQGATSISSTIPPYSDSTNWIEFTAPSGQRGSMWTYGSTTPISTTANDGDMYLDTSTSDVYQYNGSTWTKIMNLQGSQGIQGETGTQGQRGSIWTVGSTIPTAQATSGDMYLNTTTDDIYQYSTSWKVVANIKGATGLTGQQGVQGTRGSIWSWGTSAPTSTTANNGDMYLDTVNNTVYSYTDNSWSSIATITGATGAKGDKGDTGDSGPTGQRGSIWNVSDGVPTSISGSLTGDMCLDSTTGDFYQYNGSSWIKDGTLKGPTGSTGQRGSTWNVGTSNPTATSGFYTGDMYLNTSTYELYSFNGTSWVDEGSIKSTDTTLPTDLANNIGSFLRVNSSGTAYEFVTLAQLNDELLALNSPVMSFSPSSVTVDVVVEPMPTVPANRLSTYKNQIIDDTQTPVRIKMVNCFGFEGKAYFPLDCWNRSYTKIIDDMKSMGFNTIRLPFSGQAATENPMPAQDGSSFNMQADSELAGKTVLECMDAFISYAGSVGMWVLLDMHRSSAGNGTDGTPVEPTEGSQYTLEYAINAWKIMATRYKDNTTVIGADLYNEPYQLDWTTWISYAEQMGNAIQAIAPDWLMIVEGVGTYNNESYWWGGQLQGAATSVPTFTTPNKLVFSPHEYGLSVATQGATAASTEAWIQSPTNTLANWPQCLYGTWNTYWGFIYTQEIAPVLIGETGGLLGYNIDGSAMTDNQYYTKADEVAWFSNLMTYINGDFNGDGTNQVTSGFQPISLGYWAYQADSADSGGLITTDYVTHIHYKLQLLEPVLGTNDDDQET